MIKIVHQASAHKKGAASCEAAPETIRWMDVSVERVDLSRLVAGDFHADADLGNDGSGPGHVFLQKMNDGTMTTTIPGSFSDPGRGRLS